MKQIILASGSPRRKELLALMGLPFTIKVSLKEEKITKKEPEMAVQELAKMKAYDIMKQLVNPCIVIGADTIVVNENKILGKPQNKQHAFEMLNQLQGKSHQVFTGVAVLEKTNDGTVNEYVFAEKTKVNVVPMSSNEIEKYLATKVTDVSLEKESMEACLYEWQDKAGGYGIQGIFGRYIAGIEGDYYNVVGLPVCKLYQILQKMIKE